jgi:hypothetical protein
VVLSSLDPLLASESGADSTRLGHLFAKRYHTSSAVWSWTCAGDSFGLDTEPCLEPESRDFVADLVRYVADYAGNAWCLLVPELMIVVNVLVGVVGGRTAWSALESHCSAHVVLSCGFEACMLLENVLLSRKSRMKAKPEWCAHRKLQEI